MISSFSFLVSLYISFISPFFFLLFHSLRFYRHIHYTHWLLYKFLSLFWFLFRKKFSLRYFFLGKNFLAWIVDPYNATIAITGSFLYQWILSSSSSSYFIIYMFMCARLFISFVYVLFCFFPLEIYIFFSV